MIRQTYYISTGSKSAMRTLRVIRADDAPGGYAHDSYICNLAGFDNEELAIEKGREYADAMRERIGETDQFKISFAGVRDDPMIRRRGRLSARDTLNLEEIEAGRFPFGKHARTRIADAPDGYLLFFADKLAAEQNPVMHALSAACAGVALERGLIAKRDAERAERAARDALSAFIGEVGERREFDAEVLAVINRPETYDREAFRMTKLRTGNDIVIYWGLLGERGDQMQPGETVRFKATIKRHSERDGVKATIVQRPKVAA